MGNMSSRKLFLPASYCFLSAFFSATPNGTPNLAAGLRFHLELWKGVAACADVGSAGSSRSLPPMPSRPSWGSLRPWMGGWKGQRVGRRQTPSVKKHDGGGTLLVFVRESKRVRKGRERSGRFYLLGKRPSRKVGWAYWRLSALRSASDIVLASKIFAAGFTLGAVKALATSEPGQIDLMTLLIPFRNPGSVVWASVSSAVSSSVSSFARTRSATRELRFTALGRASAARLAREEDERVTATIAVGWAALWKWQSGDTVHVGKPRQ